MKHSNEKYLSCGLYEQDLEVGRGRERPSFSCLDDLKNGSKERSVEM